MVSLEHGCARCRTPCVDSGLMTKARRCWVQGKMPLHGSLPLLGAWVRATPTFPLVHPLIHVHTAGGIAGLVGNPGGASIFLSLIDTMVTDTSLLEIVMVRLQGDFAKAPEKRFNYKHCFDALFRVSSGLSPHFVSMGKSLACRHCMIGACLTSSLIPASMIG